MIGAWPYVWNYVAFLIICLVPVSALMLIGRQNRSWSVIVLALFFSICILAGRVNAAERELNTYRLTSLVLSNARFRVTFDVPPTPAEAP